MPVCHKLSPLYDYIPLCFLGIQIISIMHDLIQIAQAVNYNYPGLFNFFLPLMKLYNLVISGIKLYVK